MSEEKKLSWLVIFLPVAAVVILLVAGFFAWQADVAFQSQNNQVACTMDAMQCPDGSYVGRTGPKCEFVCPTTQTNDQVYKNTQYGFELTFPQDWAGYTVVEQKWQGRNVDTGNLQFEGPQVVLRNPNWTAAKPWQDVPVMVFTKEQWSLVLAEKLAVSAAPIGPGKLGENGNYVFALPPRWVGFTDALGQNEATSIAQTFKAF